MLEKLLSLNLTKNTVVTYVLLAMFCLAVAVGLFGSDVVAIWVEKVMTISTESPRITTLDVPWWDK